MYSKLFNLEGKRALIVGASAGIGGHCAKVLAEAGAEVMLTARSEDKLKTHCQEINRLAAVEAKYSVFDIAQPDQVENFLADLMTDNWSVDILVNCAGIIIDEPFEQQSMDSWRRVVDVNLNGNWQVAHGVAKQMRGAGISGSIINISSTASFRALAGTSPVYGVTKAGINQMTRHMALELSQDNIRVNALQLGWVRSERVESILQSEIGRQFVSTVPMKRPAEYDEISGALLLLASAAGSYMTGTILSIDGGYACNAIG